MIGEKRTQEDTASDEEGESVRLVIVKTAIAGVATLFVMISVAVYHFTRDTWAEDVRYSVPRRVDAACKLSGNDVRQAYSELRAILDESEGHKITNPSVKTALETATTKREELRLQVYKLDIQEAEEKRVAAQRTTGGDSPEPQPQTNGLASDADRATEEVMDRIMSTPEGRSEIERLGAKDLALTRFQQANGISERIAEASITEWVFTHNGNFDWDLEDVKAICLRNKRYGIPHEYLP